MGGREPHGWGPNHGAGHVGRTRGGRGLLDAVFLGVHHRGCRQRRGPANVPLSCWRGFAAAPHRGGATSKAVPISFSGVLAGLWGGRWLVGGAGALRPWLERGSRCAVWAWTAARPACQSAAAFLRWLVVTGHVARPPASVPAWHSAWRLGAGRLRVIWLSFRSLTGGDGWWALRRRG